MLVCCNLITLEIGDTCPLCGQVANERLPAAMQPVKPVRPTARLNAGYRLQSNFRFRPEHDAVAAGLAEQNGRKSLKNDGTFRHRPGKKRRAMPGPLGRRQRRGLVKVPDAA